MSQNMLDQQPEERLFTRINELERQLKEVRTLQKVGRDVLNLQSTETHEAGQSLANGSAAIFGFHLNVTEGELIFAIFSYSIFQGTTHNEANLIGGMNTLGYYYKWNQWRDWLEGPYGNGNYSLSDRIWIENNTGSTKTIVVKGEWHYLVSGGIVSVG